MSVSTNEYYIAKMEGPYLKVFKMNQMIQIIEIDETQFTPFSVNGLSDDYSDFFMYGENIVSKNVEKLQGFVAFRNRLCT